MEPTAATILPQRVRRRPLVLAVLCISLLVVSLDNTILNVALPDIVRDLHASATQLQWIVDSYIVIFAGGLLVLGSLGDRLGRKRLFLAGLVVFGAGSAASAFASSPSALIATRAVMGLGGAAIMPSTLSILTNVFPRPGERARAIGLWSGTTGLGVAIGPVVGGWLLAHFWWGSVFLVNVPIALVGAGAAALVIPDSRDPATRPADSVGAVLSVGGMGLLLWGIIEAPSRSWSSPAIIAALCGGAMLLCAFVLYERHSSHPMLELSFFSRPRFSVAVAAMAVVVFALFGALFLLTQYLQFSLGYSALQTGVRIVPIAGILLVAAPLSTFVVRAIGTTPVVGAGMAFLATGFFLLSRTTVAGTYVDALPGLCCLGLGSGLCFAPCTDAVMGSLPAARAGVGAATNSAAMQTGGALGVAVLGSLLNARYVGDLSPVLAAHNVSGALAGTITSSLGAALGVASHIGGASGAGLASLARSAFVSGMGLAFLVAAVVVVVGALGLIALLPSRPGSDPPLRRAARRSRARRRPAPSGRPPSVAALSPPADAPERRAARADGEGRARRRLY
jgi:EmrB/QacA subfamily drug resistance transporter